MSNYIVTWRKGRLDGSGYYTRIITVTNIETDNNITLSFDLSLYPVTGGGSIFIGGKTMNINRSTSGLVLAMHETKVGEPADPRIISAIESII